MMPIPNRIVAGLRLLTIAVSSTALVACVTEPYVSSAVPRPGLSVVGDAKKSPTQFEAGSTNVRTTHVSFEAAVQYGRYLQDAYEQALQNRARLRRVSNITTLWTGIATLGLEATNTGGDTTLITGLTATALGISSQVLITRDHEAAYSLGARQVGCILSAATDARPASTSYIGVTTALDRLESTLKEYRDAQSEATRKSAPLAATPDVVQELADRQLDFNKRVLRVEDASRYGNSFLTESNLLGEQLLNKIEEVRWEVNDAVRRSEPDLLVLDSNLRSVVSSRLAFSNVELDPKVKAPIEPNQGVATSGSKSLQSEWSEADRLAVSIESGLAALKAAIETLSARPMLRFPENAFAKCSSGDVNAIAAPAAITFEPASITLTQTFRGGQIAAAIRGGRGPFSVEKGTLEAKPEIEGNIVQVTITENEAKTMSSPVQVVVKDLYGNGAILSIILPEPAEPEAPAAAPGGSTPQAAGSKFLTGEDVKKVQRALFKEQKGAWLRQLQKDEPDIGLTPEQVSQETKFADGKLGLVTRRVLEHYLLTQVRTDVETKHKGEGASDKCKAAIAAISSPNPTLSFDGSGTLVDVYSDPNIGKKEKLDFDKSLIDFVVACGVIATENGAG